MIRFAALLSLIMLGVTSAHAGMRWLPVPHKVDMAHMRHASQVFRLVEGEGARLSLMRPDLAKAPITADVNGHVVIKPDGMAYFHVLIASRVNADATMTAIRYFHMFGRLTPVSPSVLLDRVKSKLEIIPDPLPREYRQYGAAHSAKFIVRFKGRPLADQTVNLTTSNGTHLEQRTDIDGQLAFTLPDDFSATHAGYMHNRLAEMLLDTAYKSDDHSYRTTLSAGYSVNPAHWRSLSGGVLVAGGGLLLGGFITWRMKRKTDADGKNSRGRKQS